MPFRARDKRWQNFDPLPVTALLFFFSILTIGLSASELFLGFSIFPLVILLASCITFTHTLLDTLLYFSGHLRPIYVLSMSVIMMLLWLTAIGFGVADITKATAESNYQYCVGIFTKVYFRQLGCLVPKARLAVEVAVLVLYIVSTTMASLAHERHAAFVHSELLAQLSHRNNVSGWQGGAAPVVVAVAGNTVDEIAPVVPQRAAGRVASWIVDEGEKMPVFAEAREEGARRVLSVRNA